MFICITVFITSQLVQSYIEICKYSQLMWCKWWNMPSLSFSLKACFRGFIQRQKYLLFKFSAVLIQQHYRAHRMRNIDRHRFHQMKNAAITIQVIVKVVFIECLFEFLNILCLFLHNNYFCRLILKSGICGISLNMFHLLLKTSSSCEKLNICSILEIEILKIVPVDVIFFFLISFIPLRVLISLYFYFSNRQHTGVIKPGSSGLAKWEQHKSSRRGSEVTRHERSTRLCSELPLLSRVTSGPNSCGLGNADSDIHHSGVQSFHYVMI